MKPLIPIDSPDRPKYELSDSSRSSSRSSSSSHSSRPFISQTQVRNYMNSRRRLRSRRWRRANSQFPHARRIRPTRRRAR